MEEEAEEISPDVYKTQQAETESMMEDETVSNPTQCLEAAAAVKIDDSQLVGSPIDAAAAVGVDEDAEPAPAAEVEAAEAEATEMTTEAAEAEAATEMTTEAAETEATTETTPEAAEAEATMETTAEVEMEVVESSRGRGGKRKRGRPARIQSKPPARNSKKREEEEVCFICFDGGNLVLCDRRFCPKAYHPGCVNRDEAFFQSRGRWNCGWHICSGCEKAANYMCYTCTYSLCKGCIKEAEFLCVRGNKGFCETCMRTVMMIEKAENGNKEMAQVDFDDRNSWEYLFKDYWLDLKGKLSLTLDELTGARNPWKGSGVLALNEGSSDELYDANDDPGSGSDSSSGHHEGSNSKRKKPKRRPKSVAIEEESMSSVKAVGSEGASVPDDTDWASKELLEFVEHMKDGDKSVLSQFDVQALLLEYIKRNNLRDPRRKSQIICDLRLQNLFGKARVGHFEMLKLLESHFLIKESSSQVFTDDVQQGATDTDAIHFDTEGNVDTPARIGSDKKRKTRKKNEERLPQLNLDDYAAIDVHNINLIYLRRNLMEDLLQDIDKFQDKVVGSFVRIRISGTGQKQDMYRLVQVVGTAKAAEAYKTGKTTTDTMVEILNLNKTEIISIDAISNQEFSEEECKRLRQSIKCGLISRLTVGEVQEKARALQAVRVNDWLETEIMRLSHLRDRASEKGRRKELRECIEKVQLLSTPEERSRRLHELPEVHADPNMDPSYESDEDEGELDENKKDNHMRPRDAGFSRKGRDPMSPGRGSSGLISGWDGTRKNSSISWEAGANMPTKGSGLDKGDASISPGSRTNETLRGQGKDTHLDNGSWSSQPVSTGAATSSKINENEKIWHYQDPSGKIQGPFSMIQLRKWSTTGYFPADLRIWKTSEKQEDSMLLADALLGKFHNEQSHSKPQLTSFSQPQLGTSNKENSLDFTRTERKQNDGSWNTSRHANDNGTPTLEVVNPKEGWVGNSSQVWDSSKGASTTWSGQSQGHSHETNLNQHRAPSHHGRDGRSGGNSSRWNSGQNRENNWSANRPTGFQSSGHGYERRSSNVGSSGQSSGWGANQGIRNDFPNSPTPTTPTPTPTPTPQPSSGGWSGGPTTTPTPQPSSGGWSGGPITTPTPQAGSGGWSGGSPPTPTPQPSSGSWPGGQGTEEWSPTATVSVPPSSGWGANPDSSGNDKQQSFAMGTQSVRHAGWSDQPPSSPTPSAGGLNSNLPSASMLKPTEGLRADQGGASDLSNLPSPTPKPKSGGWAVTQGAENKWAAASSVFVPPTISGSVTASTPGGNGAQLSSAVVNERNKIAAESNNQPPTLVLPSVGGWNSGSVSSSIPNETEMADGRNAAQILPHTQSTHSSASLPAPVGPIAQEDGWGSHASDAPKSTLLEPKASGSLPNQSVPELSNNRVAGNTDMQLLAVGPTTPEPNIGCHTNQISHMVDSTPKAGALTSDGVSSQSNWNIPSQSNAAGVEPLVLHNNAFDSERKMSEADAPTAVESAVAVDARALNPSHGPEVDWRASTDISAKPPVDSHGWGPAATSQNLEVTGSNLRPVFESHGWGEPASGPKQEQANSTPKPELVGGWGPSHPVTNNTASQTGNLMVPPNPNRNNWAMPPTAQIPQPPSWDVGNSQNNTLAPPSNQTPTPGNNPWPAGPAPVARPAKTRWGPENPSASWGMTGPGNTNTGWVAPPQGITNNGSGTAPQGYPNTGWDASGGNPNAWGGLQKQNEERFSAQGGRGFQGSDSGGHGGGRPSWNRSSSFGGGESGGSSRPPLRGQRGVCRFHENGHCKKGASCPYLHT